MSAVTGKPLDRVDGRAKVTGEAQYSADIPIDRLAYGVIFEITIAKGRVVQIDTQAAERAFGVLGVITHLKAPKLFKVNMFPHGPAGESLVPLQQDTVLLGWGMATAAYPVYLSPAAARVKLFADGHALA